MHMHSPLPELLAAAFLLDPRQNFKGRVLQLSYTISHGMQDICSDSCRLASSRVPLIRLQVLWPKLWASCIRVKPDVLGDAQQSDPFAYDW